MANSRFVAEVEHIQGHIHVLLITTGSVASVKAPLIVRQLLSYDKVKVEVVATEPSLSFYKREEIEDLGVRVWTDIDEWPSSYKIGDPILHIELRRWADVVLVAPCSANTLAKLSGGICDNLATSLLRALAPSTPTYIFPAMNTFMYEHPLTQEHIRIIRDVIRYNVIGPIGKTLACGDIGMGAMTEWVDIVQIVVHHFGLVPRVVLPSTMQTPGTKKSASPKKAARTKQNAGTKSAARRKKTPYTKEAVPHIGFAPLRQSRVKQTARKSTGGRAPRKRSVGNPVE